MNILHRRLVPVLLAVAAAVAAGVPLIAAAQPISVPAGVVSAKVSGTLTPAASARSGNPGSASDPSNEPVVFDGQATLTGRVINDTTFGTPPVLELIVDMSGVTATGARTKQAYQVQTTAIVHRPLLASEQYELGFSISTPGNALLARSGLATFGVQYNAGTMTATPIKVAPHPPS
jgi:hypothetical protein